jgi:DNA-binding MarR family transcriptional regulator
LTSTTNFVNKVTGVIVKDASMAPSKQKAPRKAMPFRKTSQVRRSSRPAIDLGVLNEKLGYFARRLQVWIFQDFIRRLARIDISPAQFSVLVVIAANPGLSQADLAATLGIERARLVRLLHRLEQRGLTQRLPSSADGRRHELRLTRDGQKTLTQAKALAARHEAAVKRRLGEGRYRLLLGALREF